MYHFLSRAIKKRLIEELRFCFDSNPRHRDIVKNIQQKYTFTSRPQKGIVLESANANPQSLSANNYMGAMHSYLMLARVDDHEGTALEWVKEDDKAVRNNGGYFPSDPGVYYIQVEEITLPGDIPEFQFWVDPLLSVYEELIFEFGETDGVGSQATLANAPLLEGTVDLYAYPDYPLLAGTAIRLQAEESLYVGGGTLTLGYGEGFVPVVATSDLPEDFLIDATNNKLVVEVNGVYVDTTLPEGSEVSTGDLVATLKQSFDMAGLAPSAYAVEDVGGFLRITAAQSLRFESNSVSTANDDLGFTEGYVPVDATGIVVQAHVPPNSTFRAVVDGEERIVELFPGNRDVEEIAAEVQAAFVGTSLQAEAVEGGDYTLDPDTGTITFLTAFSPGTQVIADYKYPVDSRGPFRIGKGEVSNNEAIPGAVLAFGNQLVDGDVAAVVVGPRREEVADVYGGKMNMSLDFSIFARDSMTRNELADLALMYLWQWRRERLAEEGIILEDVSFGGESEEPYDDVGDDYYYLASISVSLLTDWELYIEKPLFIRRVTTSSFEQDARRAAHPAGVLSESPDLLQGIPENRLKEFSRIYVVDPKGDYERVR